MARPNTKGSSFRGLGLRPKEQEKFINLLTDADLSAGQLIRGLVRVWMDNGGGPIPKSLRT